MSSKNDKKSQVEKRKSLFLPTKYQNDEKPTTDKNHENIVEKSKREIDDIFASVKIPAIPNKSQSTKRKLKLNDDDGFSDSRGTKNRKITEDGLPIFDIKELNIGHGGAVTIGILEIQAVEHKLLIYVAFLKLQ
ncbi:12776_t:CDS:2 [Funneliformis geosporum]|uniref:12776_t:CDS:1 n=1 Tax=Funneliformis geosporum TaxID=1117311 RepID=A0A9W4X004_9GLOM|nr:12776_t:CDS:2 [Funneliformis geosporum]